MLFTSPISLLFFLTIVPLLSFMMTGRRGVLHDSFFENIQPLISPFFEETWLRKWNHIDAASHAPSRKTAESANGTVGTSPRPKSPV